MILAVLFETDVFFMKNVYYNIFPTLKSGKNGYTCSIQGEEMLR